jgi:hypothetical protein
MAVTGEEVRLAIGKAMEWNGWLRGVITDDVNWKTRTALMLKLHEVDKVIEMDRRSYITVNAVNLQGDERNRWLARGAKAVEYNRTVQFRVLKPQDKALQALYKDDVFEVIDAIQEFMEKRYERARSLSVRPA